MTEAEARELCTRLAREHPDRADNQWFAREADDGWIVQTPTVEAKPKPPQADDPRPAHQRNMPGAWG